MFNPESRILRFQKIAARLRIVRPASMETTQNSVEGRYNSCLAASRF